MIDRLDDTDRYILEVMQQAEEKEFSESDIKEIELSNLTENPFQSRLDMKEEELKDLSNSIKENGLLQPIIVSRRDDNSFLTIAGHRRVEATKLLGEKKIKAIVLHDVSEKDIATYMMIENMQREDLDIIEESIALNHILKQGIYKNQAEFAYSLGINRSNLSKKLKLVNLSEKILNDVKENKSTKDFNALFLIQKVNDKKRQEDLYFSFLQNGRDWLINELKPKDKEKSELMQISIKNNKLSLKIPKDAKFKPNAEEELIPKIEKLVKRYIQ